MEPDPFENPVRDQPRRETVSWPWRFVGGGALFLVVLGPLVSDEPLHLSGVMTVLGVASAALALVSGIATAVRSGPSDRGSRALAAACGFVLLAGWLVWWFAKMMSELS